MVEHNPLTPELLGNPSYSARVDSKLLTLISLIRMKSAFKRKLAVLFVTLKWYLDEGPPNTNCF